MSQYSFQLKAELIIYFLRSPVFKYFVYVLLESPKPKF